jgi:hypothetical protein
MEDKEDVDEGYSINERRNKRECDFPLSLFKQM